VEGFLAYQLRFREPWMMCSILENATKDDVELREIIGDAIGNPEEMRRRVCSSLTILQFSFFSKE
jgi:hypothetical protein